MMTVPEYDMRDAAEKLMDAAIALNRAAAQTPRCVTDDPIFHRWSEVRVLASEIVDLASRVQRATRRLAISAWEDLSSRVPGEDSFSLTPEQGAAEKAAFEEWKKSSEHLAEEGFRPPG